jgi:HD-GYP domain-containing protein (c-di-GMP phosphodiesterase class II)
MNTIKLKKVIFKEANMQAIEETIKMLGVKIAIADSSGIIYGDEQGLEDKQRYVIAVENVVLGQVIGDNKASAVACIISAMCSSEKEKKALADEALEKYREINILYNVAEKIATTAGVNAVSSVVVTEAMKHIESTYAAIFLLNEEDESFEIVCQMGDKISISESFEHSVLRAVAAKRTGEIINDIKSIEGLSQQEQLLKSLICAPITVKSKAIGIMLIGSSSLREYTSSDLKLCNALAAQGGAAIEAANLYQSLRENFYDTVQILSQIIEMKDSYKDGHHQRIRNYSLNIGRAMGISKIDLVKLKLAVMLRDIGNLAISDEVFNKKDNYTEEEYEIVKMHSEVGANMLSNIDQLKDIIPVIRSHHELYDGSGYPDGLKGEEIPVFSRIIAVADAFDAMTNDRPHKASMNLYFAAEELSKNKGIKYDPEIVETFFNIYKGKKLEEMQEYVYSE